MVHGFVGVKQKNFPIASFFNEPGLSQIDESSTVDEHEHVDSLVAFLGLFDFPVQLTVTGDGVYVELDALSFEEFLSYLKELRRAF